MKLQVLPYVTVEVDGSFTTSTADETVRVDARPNKTVLTVATFQSHGASHTATLARR